MKKYTVGGREVTLGQQNYVAKGGEGMIFNLGSLAFKIYEDLDKMIPEAKIKELNILEKDNILRPLDLVYDQRKKIVGFTMKWLGDAVVALCKLFTTSYQQSNNISNDQITLLIENMKETIQFIHDRDCLIVDGNELNYLVDSKDFVTPYFIDVNSWQTKSFPATAIMPSIRDYRSKGYSVGTDWFSFAIVTFQLFVGIHPFKGRAPNYGLQDFQKRIIDCVSVLNPKVHVPPTTRDFSLIPGPYMDWYLKVFEKGERIPPPLKAGQAIISQPKFILIQSTNNFDITELRKFASTVLFNAVIQNNEIIKTRDALFINQRDYAVSKGVEVLFVPTENIPIFVKITNDKSEFYCPDPNYKLNNIQIECTDKMVVNNVLYLRNKENLIEMSFIRMGEKIIISPKMTWAIERSSSKLLSNIVSQSILGKAFIAIPLPDYSKSKLIIKPIPELDDYQIIDGKHENRICMFNVTKNGEYSRVTLVFSKDYTTYKYYIKENIDYVPINFVTLENGVCISITHDNAVEIFVNRPEATDVKRIEDPSVDSTMHLCHDGTQVRFFKENVLYTIKMRK